MATCPPEPDAACRESTCQESVLENTWSIRAVRTWARTQSPLTARPFALRSTRAGSPPWSRSSALACPVHKGSDEAAGKAMVVRLSHGGAAKMVVASLEAISHSCKICKLISAATPLFPRSYPANLQGIMADILKPYVLFLGDVPDALAAENGHGHRRLATRLVRRPDPAGGLSGRYGPSRYHPRRRGPQRRPHLRDRSGQCRRRAAGSLGSPTSSRPWTPALDVASGLHTRLEAIPAIAQAATAHGRALHNVRHVDQTLATGKGTKRPGLRVLTVGTDCSIGKKYTALALEKAMQARGMKASFRATGQTGVLISGRGLAIDSVVADFISGAAEWIAPANDPDHWDVVEGQGSLFHPSFAGVTLGLLHGAQPDAFIVCHEPTRTAMRGVPTPPAIHPAGHRRHGVHGLAHQYCHPLHRDRRQHGCPGRACRPRLPGWDRSRIRPADHGPGALRCR